MSLNELAEILSLATLGERAGRVEVRHEHRLLRAENLVRLSHEVHTTHEDDIGIRACSLLGESETVAHEVGDVLEYALGVVVREDDGVLLLTHAADFSLEIDAFGNGFIDIAFLFPAIFDLCHVQCGFLWLEPYGKGCARASLALLRMQRYCKPHAAQSERLPFLLQG